MQQLEAALLGLIEGLTEFLPISSTGHLLIADRLLALPEASFNKTFEIVIQFGAILAVVMLYWRTLLVNRIVLVRVLTAFVPTGLLGFLLYRIVKEHFLTSLPLVLWSLAIGGLVIIVFEILHGERRDARPDLGQVTTWQALGIGTFQALAMIPGVSRSAATVLGGLTLGVGRKASVEFSFLLAVPTMAVASGYTLIKEGADFSADQWNLLLIGFVVSFIVAVATVKFMLRYIKTHTFAPFGVYRIVAALLFAYWIYWR